MQIILGGGCFWCLQGCFELLPNINSVTCGYAGGLTQNPTYEEVCSGKTGHIEVVLIDYSEPRDNFSPNNNHKDSSKSPKNFDTKNKEKSGEKTQNNLENNHLQNLGQLNNVDKNPDLKNSHSTLEQILDLFWQIHNPTTLNQQGADIGSQYASAIFWQNTEQLEIINQTLEKLKNSGKYQNQIVTKIEQKVDFSTTFWKAIEKHQNYFAKNPNQGYCQIVVLPKIQKTKKLLQID